VTTRSGAAAMFLICEWFVEELLSDRVVNRSWLMSGSVAMVATKSAHQLDVAVDGAFQASADQAEFVENFGLLGS
jgi:hypothetical protein